jgi:nucleoside-diphosphate-sugar epimerase
MAGKTVLVTGANGFVGRALCRGLAQRGLDVRAAVRSAESAARLGCRSIAVGDIDAHTDWDVALAGVDAVAHLAGRAHIMQEDEADPLRAYRSVNVAGSVRLAERAIRAGVRRIVFLSSIKVNGEETGDREFTERDAPRPCDAYAISKLEAEIGLAQVCASRIELTVLRPPLIYGNGAKGNLLALMRAVDRGWPLPIGAIRNRRSLLALENLVSAIAVCLDHPRAAGSTFLVADERPVSTPELAVRIGVSMQRDARIWPFPVALLRATGALLGRSDAVGRLASSLLVDSRRIREQLQWQPAQSFEDGIAEMVRGYRAQGA